MRIDDTKKMLDISDDDIEYAEQRDRSVIRLKAEKFRSLILEYRPLRIYCQRGRLWDEGLYYTMWFYFGTNLQIETYALMHGHFDSGVMDNQDIYDKIEKEFNDSSLRERWGCVWVWVKYH